MQEQEIAAVNAGQPSSVQRGKVAAADLVITAAVTEFEPQTSGGAAGIGGGGRVGRGVLGGLIGGALNKAHMALDIRIVDASTSEVLAATRVQGSASDIAGGIGVGFLGSWGLGAGLSGYANTPMEKAIRVCIIEAVKYISQSVPMDYYKY
jgi:curli biogenesis system outer membrane secretion channel CsgG